MDEPRTQPAVITTTNPAPIKGNGNVTTASTTPPSRSSAASKSSSAKSATDSSKNNTTNVAPAAFSISPSSADGSIGHNYGATAAANNRGALTTANASAFSSNKSSPKPPPVNTTSDNNGHQDRPKMTTAARGNAINGSTDNVFASIASTSSNPRSVLGGGGGHQDNTNGHHRLAASASRSDSGVGANSGGGAPASPTYSPTTSIGNGSFLRHQFFRSHRAHPASPTTIRVSSMDSSPRAATLAHRQALASLSSAPSPLGVSAASPTTSGGGGVFPSNAQLAGSGGPTDTLAPASGGYGAISACAQSAYSMQTRREISDEAAAAAAGSPNSIAPVGYGCDDPLHNTASTSPDPSIRKGGSEEEEEAAASGGGGNNGGIGDSLRRLLHSATSISGDGEVDEEVRKQSITVLPLLGLMFCNSIGGGYGLEESLESGGAFITILGVLILPIVFSLPIALVVAELATSVPTNGGFLMWINVSMPPVMYFFSVIVTLLLTFVDNALYPVLFSDYVCQWADCSDYGRKGLRLLALGGACLLNLLGIEAVGIASILITIISVAPFALMFVWHMGKYEGYVNWDNIKEVPANIEWVGLLSTLSWNVAGLEQAGSLAEDIQNPQRTIMLSMIPLIGLVWLSYIPPVFAGVSQSHAPEDWSVWETGHWALVADQIGGLGFKTFLVLGSIFSSLGLCLSCLCVTSRVMAGMGEAMAFPSVISKVLMRENKKFNTPHWSILINTVLTGVCTVMLDFSALVTVASSLYGIRILLVFMACIKLRYAYPTLERPFRIPVSTDKLVLLLAFPIIYCVALVVTGAFSSNENIAIFAAVLIGSFAISYFYCRYFRPHGFDGGILRVEEYIHTHLGYPQQGDAGAGGGHAHAHDHTEESNGDGLATGYVPPGDSRDDLNGSGYDAADKLDGSSGEGDGAIASLIGVSGNQETET